MNAKDAKTRRKYMESDAWKIRREAAKERAGSRCQLCNASGPLHVHHRTYERFGREDPMDLTVLCAPCHRRHHHPVVVLGGDDWREGRSNERAARRRRIDDDIVEVLRSGPRPWRVVKGQVGAPGAQAWARAQRMLKSGRLCWVAGGKLLKLAD